jgi:hypothetical protein
LGRYFGAHPAQVGFIRNAKRSAPSPRRIDPPAIPVFVRLPPEPLGKIVYQRALDMLNHDWHPGRYSYPYTRYIPRKETDSADLNSVNEGECSNMIMLGHSPVLVCRHMLTTFSAARS